MELITRRSDVKSVHIKGGTTIDTTGAEVEVSQFAVVIYHPYPAVSQLFPFDLVLRIDFVVKPQDTPKPLFADIEGPASFKL
jgi:hypothetical protein